MPRCFSTSEPSQGRTDAKREAMDTAKAQIPCLGLPGGLQHAIPPLASVFSSTRTLPSLDILPYAQAPGKNAKQEGVWEEG